MKKALIVYGGWDGHDPAGVADIFADILRKENFEVDLSDDLKTYEGDMKQYDLIVPHWTMGDISSDGAWNVSEAVASGVGIAGCHAGLCDAFRSCDIWQFMTGAQFVGHPGGCGTTYTVNIRRDNPDPITDGIEDFEITSEQYYLHVDPAVNVLATTRFPVADWHHSSNGVVDVPAMFTKKWGEGRVFYLSVGHDRHTFDIPQARELMRRGFLYAAR